MEIDRSNDKKQRNYVEIVMFTLLTLVALTT